MDFSYNFIEFDKTTGYITFELSNKIRIIITSSFKISR